MSAYSEKTSRSDKQPEQGFHQKSVTPSQTRAQFPGLIQAKYAVNNQSPASFPAATLTAVRGAGGIKVNVSGSMAPAAQFMIAVKTTVGGALTATGDGHRPRGSLSGGDQGDHTTAYVTFEHQMINAIYGKTPEAAWNDLVTTHYNITTFAGYAESQKWLITQSDKILSDNQKVDATKVTAKDVETYANNILTIRNRMAYTSLATKGGSTGGQNEATHAGGLQAEEVVLRQGKKKRYSKNDIMTSMMRALDHQRLKKSAVDGDALQIILKQHVASIIDTYFRVAKEYGISEKDLIDYYNKYSWA